MPQRQPSPPLQTPGPWPHRLAWVLACATAMLIWVGGNVTTYDAGMAVADWPTTYGHWFYPIQQWLGKGWDLFLEHGHRMLAQLVGLLTIAMAVVLWRCDPRKGVRWLGLAAVAGVIFQGTLGGLRVIGGSVVGWLEVHRTPLMGLFRLLGDDVLLRRVHGCTAPLFLAMCAAMVTLTSPAWRDPCPSPPRPAARRVQRSALVATLLVYLMIVLGALLRHQPVAGGAGGFEVWAWLQRLSGGWIATWFALWVALKLILAGLVLAQAVWLWLDVRRRFRDQTRLVRRAQWLLGLLLVQIVLAAATWVTNYGWPAWFTRYVWSIQYTIVQEGRWQVITTTLHSAVGSLVLICTLSLTLWSHRLLQRAGS